MPILLRACMLFLDLMCFVIEVSTLWLNLEWRSGVLELSKALFFFSLPNLFIPSNVPCFRLVASSHFVLLIHLTK